MTATHLRAGVRTAPLGLAFCLAVAMSSQPAAAQSPPAQTQPAQGGGTLATVKNVATKVAPVATKAVQAVRNRGTSKPAGNTGAPSGQQQPAASNPSMQQKAVDALRNVAGSVTGGGNNSGGTAPATPQPAYQQPAATPAAAGARPAPRPGAPPS